MGLSINSNPLALQVANQLNRINEMMQETSLRLSTGKRILSAKDDPAGIGILSSLKAQSASYDAVQKNLKDGMSLLDTATTSLNNQQEILKQMKSLATQASSDLLSASSRTALQNTFAQLQTQLDSAVNKASIFGQNLTGAAAANVNIQSGINNGDTTTLTAAQSDAATLGVDAGSVDLSTVGGAQAALAAIDTAVTSVSGNQSILGAQSRGLEVLFNNAQNVQENIDKAASRIEDVDIAKESSNLTKMQVQQQVATQLLSVINQLPAAALQLLRG